jgi:hypothetical protein
MYRAVVSRGERIWLGYFDGEVEAVRAYDRMAVELFGAFARLNFLEGWPPQRRAEVYAQRQEPSDEDKRKKAKGKRENVNDKDATARTETRERRERKRTTKSARAMAPKPGRKGKTKNRKDEGRGAPPQ